ncbi:MAG: alkaline phosphatase [Bacteroidia bacterium]|nr:MAG: alkaline phosphatase [Bacteroidia bacterium]
MSFIINRLIVIVLLTSVASSGCSRKSYLLESSGRPKNVILIIGDGMGLAHLYAGMSSSKKELNVAKSKYIGISLTYSDDDYTTDSGASGTAMATGVKTRNGMIGMRPDSSIVPNLIELAHRQDLAGGVVSTSSVVHATPASFVAHSTDRNHYDDIALGYLKTKPEVFIGGGYRNFALRADSLNLIRELEEAGYQVVLTEEELIGADAAKLAGLLADEHLPKMSEGRGDMLSYSAIKAIETLNKNEKGFFLMIEASQIDWAAHDHDTRYLTEEVLDMDRTVGVVLDFAERNGETLVIVTADHETGGMTLPSGNREELSVNATYTTIGHTGIPVPVYSFGPGADQFTGFFENTDIFKKIKDLLKL